MIILSIVSCSTNPWAQRNLKLAFDKNQGTAFLLCSFLKPRSLPASREGGKRQLFPTEAEWTQMGGLYPSVRISKQIFTLRDRHVHKLRGPSQFPHYEIKCPLWSGLLPCLKYEPLFADSTCVKGSWICGTDKRRLWWKIRSFNASDSLEFFFEVEVWKQTW